MKRHTCIDRNDDGGGGGGCTGARTDAQYLSYVAFNSFARRLHETVTSGFDEIRFTFK